MNWYVLAYGFQGTTTDTLFDTYADDYLLINDGMWDVIKDTRFEEARERQRHMAALAPQLPPISMTTGKAIMPRARRNLPQGVRNRFGREEV